MAVDHLDDFIPKGLEPSHLGYSVSDGDIHLISLYESPLTRGQVNGYVVLVTDGSSIDRYDWCIEWLEGGMQTPERPKYELTTRRCGRIHWRPKHEGIYKISVNVVGSSSERPLELIQHVRRTDPDFENLKEIKRDRILPAGHAPTMRRVLYDAFTYVRGAARADEGLTVRLLSSLVYSSALHLGTMLYSESLAWPPSRLLSGRAREMRTWPLYKLLNGERRRGICRIDPVVFAYRTGVLELPEGPPTKPRALRHALLTAYRNLKVNKKKDIANRLRFPKQNIAIASMLLRQLKTDWEARATAEEGFLGPADVSLDERIETLGTLYGAGDTALCNTREHKRSVRFIPAKDDKLGNKLGNQFRSSYHLPAICVLLDHVPEIEERFNEWSEFPDAHGRFEGGLVQYVWLASYYRKQHDVDPSFPEIRNLAEWVDQNIVPITFSPFQGGTEIFVHSDLEVPLKEVAESINDISIEKMSGFVPRMIKGKSVLSNHAIGKAIDFDHPSNPMIQRKHLLALEKALRISPLHGRKQTYNEMAALNLSFMEWFEDVLLNHLAPEPYISTAVYDDFHKWWQAGGIMTLPEELVSEMTSRGFTWGGNWPKSRDSMHFDFKD